MNWPARLFLAFAAACVLLHPASAVTIPTVPVGNAGNAPDNSNLRPQGAVSYNYRIGTTEVTNAQYVEFLNAVATTSDPLGLYNTNMATSNPRGGISATVSNGIRTYFANTNFANKPVNNVSWYDAARFVNWLHNGQPTGPEGPGTTETGAYTLLGGTPIPSNGLSVARNPDATWFLPTNDEWHKAAFYDPTLNSGNGGYWEYATRSNTAPTIATANSVGDISNPGANVANYNDGVNWNRGYDGNVTTVGSAGPLSESYYGTSDQSGNAWEWTEDFAPPDFRIVRGGGYSSPSDWLAASFGGTREPQDELNADSYGFRVATVPEPSTVILAAFGLAALAAYGWRRKR